MSVLSALCQSYVAEYHRTFGYDGSSIAKHCSVGTEFKPRAVSGDGDGLILYANAQLASVVPTAGVTRGEIVSDQQQRLQVPVGDRLLGRMLNLFGFFGEAIDRKEPIAGGEWRSIHAEPRCQRALPKPKSSKLGGDRSTHTFGTGSQNRLAGRCRRW